MKKQVVLRIYGRVLGVFFRDSCKEKARELNLSGWVRNEPDDTVQIVAEGEEEDLKKLIEWCRNGPDHARVGKVDVKWLDANGRFDNFIVK